MPSGPGPAASDHVTFLDHFRGLAILLVFGFHALCAAFGTCTLPWDGWFRNFDVSRSFLLFFPLTYGWIGVAIFFVISGFCIHLSYARSTPLSFQAFFIRRLFRIYPPYLVALILFSTLIRPSNPPIESDNWLSHALLLHNLSQEFYYAINSSFWSIAVEAQLYLIYPLLVLMTKRWGWTSALIITGLIESILRVYGTYQGLLTDAPAGQLLLAPMWLHQGPLKYWFSWSIGAWIAQRYLDGAPPMVTQTLCSLARPALIGGSLQTTRGHNVGMDSPRNPGRHRIFPFPSPIFPTVSPSAGTMVGEDWRHKLQLVPLASTAARTAPQGICIYGNH